MTEGVYTPIGVSRRGVSVLAMVIGLFLVTTAVASAAGCDEQTIIGRREPVELSRGGGGQSSTT